MKAKFLLMCTMILVVMFGFAASANAQSICDIAAVTPLSGAAGSTVNASGGLSCQQQR